MASQETTGQFERAVTLHRSGRLNEAADLYRDILRLEPDHFRALHLLGVVELEQGRYEEALRRIEAALRLQPRWPTALYNRGNALRRLRRPAAALASYDQALTLTPDDADAHNNRGLVLQDLQRPAEALASFDRALALRPDFAEAYRGRALALRSMQRLEEALVSLDHARSVQAEGVEACNLRGELLHDLGRPDEALASYDQALAQAPDYAEAYNNRGLALHSLRRHDEARADFDRAVACRQDYAEAYNNRGAVLQSLRRSEAALADFDRALILKPDFAAAHNNRGLALQALQRPAEAVASYRQACTLQPDYAAAYFNRAYSLTVMRHFEEALADYDRALAIDPTHALAHNNRGNVLRDLYRLEESAASFERALALQPDQAEVFTGRLLGLLYQTDKSPQAIAEEHHRFGERFETPLKSLWPHHRNDRSPDRRLKVGYVSADFRRHSVAYFLEPILVHHDKNRVEVYAYYNAAQHDEVTVRLESYTDHWRVCVGWPDEQLAEQISIDGIDILVDLSGHTGKNRLLTFARKPAPVQVTYLGYAATTGLTAMDWRLTHADVDPTGSEEYYSEQLYRLPRSLWCYRPSPEFGAVAAEPPLVRRGHVTFGSMNNLAKVSVQAIAVWAAVLQALPGARLVMTHVPAGAAASIREHFAIGGVEADRLTLHDRLPAPEYRAVMNEIDIALDPFPYNGTTTTCDTLWQGIPVISLAGNSAVARSGLALLRTVGLEELIAQNDADYITRAVSLANDPLRLKALRQTLRSRVEASALRDEAGFTRDLEVAYRQMWHQWCRAKTP